MPLRRTVTKTGAILYEPSRIDHPLDHDFDAEALAAAGRVVATPSGRGRAWVVLARGTGDRWVLRHYRRGGLVARVVADRYLWLGEEATRAFRELRLLAELERRGLPAARPVAARYERLGPAYRADLLTVAVDGARTWTSLLGPDLPLALWWRLGGCIRRFHDAGVFHADLNAHNVLVDRAERIHLIDFDRGALRAPGAWRQANLARLERSLAKVAAGDPARYRAEHWAALLDGYATRSD